MGGKSSKKLNKEDLEFLLNNTSFTKPQIKQWYKGFMVSNMLLTTSQGWLVGCWGEGTPCNAPQLMVKALGEPALQKIYKLLLQEKQVCESLSVHMSTPLGAGLTSPFRLNTLGGYST